MKNFMLTAGMVILLTAGYSTVADNPDRPAGVHSAQPNYVAAVKLSGEDMRRLTGNYEASLTGGTKGGTIGLKELSALLESIPDDDAFVNFRFCKDESGNTSLMLMGGKSWYQLFTKVDCLRNGGSSAAFCPPNCNFESGAVSVDITRAEFNDLSETYKENNPGKTWGGNIDKSALMGVVKSLPDNAGTLSFMFCTDGSLGKTSVIFIGGTNGQADGQPLIIRNGVSAESFCPNMCSFRN